MIWGVLLRYWNLLFQKRFDELKQISDDWLSGSTEMQFSVGHFSEHYISKAPIGVIKDKENAIIGFVHLCLLMIIQLCLLI